jgi:CRP-like cAMP-binding protein
MEHVRAAVATGSKRFDGRDAHGQPSTAEERYGLLLTHEPEIALRAPLRHIASYLGITPESLSRIRRKRADGK